MKYKLAIFDMDGTILNTLDDLTDAVNYALTYHDLPTHTIDEVRFFVGNGIHRLIELAVPENSSAELIEAVYQSFVPYYQEHSHDKTAPYEGIKETIKKLREAGCLTAVVSNKVDAAVQILANEFFPNLFDIAIGEREGIKRKPAPDEVNIALKALCVSRNDAVYIGDSDVDMATANNSQMDLIAVDWGFRSRDFLIKAGASTIVSAPEEILNIICDTAPHY